MNKKSKLKKLKNSSILAKKLQQLSWKCWLAYIGGVASEKVCARPEKSVEIFANGFLGD